jgi:hypothetical protein
LLLQIYEPAQFTAAKNQFIFPFQLRTKISPCQLSSYIMIAFYDATTCQHAHDDDHHEGYKIRKRKWKEIGAKKEEEDQLLNIPFEGFKKKIKQQ